MRDGHSLENVLVILDNFKKVSGLSLNYDKSFGLQFGQGIILEEKGLGLQWVEKISVLGLDFHKNISEDEQVTGDMQGYYDKMRNVCEVWKRRKLA